MSSINVLNIIPLNPEAKFTDSLKFDVFFECLSELPNGSLFNLDLEWKVIYIGSAESDKYDQVLKDPVCIGPVSVGTMQFCLEVFF